MELLQLTIGDYSLTPPLALYWCVLSLTRSPSPQRNKILLGLKFYGYDFKFSISDMEEASYISNKSLYMYHLDTQQVSAHGVTSK